MPHCLHRNKGSRPPHPRDHADLLAATWTRPSRSTVTHVQPRQNTVPRRKIRQSAVGSMDHATLHGANTDATNLVGRQQSLRPSMQTSIIEAPRRVVIIRSTYETSPSWASKRALQRHGHLRVCNEQRIRTDRHLLHVTKLTVSVLA